MPTLSLFTPCGMLELSGRAPVGLNFYRAIIAAYGKGYDFTPQGVSGQPNHMEASAYARAMSLARVKNALTRAGNQYNPGTAWDLLLLQAEDWGVIPVPTDTIPSLQAKIAAAQVLRRGARTEAMVAGLRGILGANFIAYRPLATSEATSYPTWPSSTARQLANPVKPTTNVKMCVLVDPVGVTGSPVTVTYTNLDPLAGEVDLAAGDVVMVQPENTAVSEKVTVSSVTPSGVVAWAASAAYALGTLISPPAPTGFYYKVVVAGTTGASSPTFPVVIGATVTDGTALLQCFGPTPAPRKFTATFANGHDVGANVTTMSWPYWWSTQLFTMIVVTATAAIDNSMRTQVNAFMGKTAREGQCWAIVAPTSPGVLGPFTIGSSAMGTVPLGPFAYVPSP